MKRSQPPAAAASLRDARGLTAPEVLLIVAIAIILYAILFPVFHRTGSHAGKDWCYPNLKQIGTALLQYAQDYDERLPGCTMGGERNSWRVLILPYSRHPDLYSCRSNPHGKREELCLDGRFPISYAANGCSAHIGGEAPMAPDKGFPLRQADALADLILVAESSSPRSDIPTDTPVDDWRRKHALFAGHAGTGIYLYADGHVKALPPSRTATPGSEHSPTNLWAVNRQSKPGPGPLIERLKACEHAYR